MFKYPKLHLEGGIPVGTTGLPPFPSLFYSRTDRPVRLNLNTAASIIMCGPMKQKFCLNCGEGIRKNDVNADFCGHKCAMSHLGFFE